MSLFATARPESFSGTLRAKTDSETSEAEPLSQAARVSRGLFETATSLFNVSDGNRSYSEWFDIYDKQRFGEPTMAGFRVDYAVTAWRPLPKASESEEK